MSGGRRVLQVVGSLRVGGAETMIVTATRELIRMGYVVDFLVFGDSVGSLESEAERLGSRIYRLDAPATAGHRRFIRNLTEMLRAEGPFDVVHSHVNLASGMVLAAAGRAGVPVRIAHSHLTHDTNRGLKRTLYSAWSRRLLTSRCTAMVACGEEAGLHLFGRPWVGRGVVVPNGADVDAFVTASSARSQIRDDLGIDSETILAGVIGRMVPVKNHEFLLDVLELGSRSGLHLLIVGEGDLRGELEERVRRSGLESQVTFLGLRRDIPRILASLDYVLMPSRHEGLPMTLVEAQAAGTPALVSSAVTTEVDLGLGMLRFLPIDDPRVWRQALLEPAHDTVTEADIRRRFVETGYDSASSARRLAALYGSSG